MRACAVCFFSPRRTHDVVSNTGECWNRPPVVIGVPGAPDDEGRVEVTTISVRPTVGLQEFCHFFSHHNEQPKAPEA